MGGRPRTTKSLELPVQPQFCSGSICDEAGGPHARQLACAPGDLVELAHVGLRRHPMPEVQRQDVGRFHARIGVPKPDQLADEHRGADRQHERHRDFRDDQPVADAALPGAHRAAAVRLLQRRLRRPRVVARGNSGRRHAQRDAGDRADRKQEREDAPVDADLVGARKSRRPRPGPVAPFPMSQSAGRPTPPTSDSTRLSVTNWRTRRPRPAPSAERDRHFLGANGHPRQREVRDVRAGERQQQSDGAEQQEQHAADRRRHDRFSQRLEVDRAAPSRLRELLLDPTGD